MPNGIVEGLFLAAFWAPPLVVVACALTLLVRPSERRTAPIATRTPAVHH